MTLGTKDIAVLRAFVHGATGDSKKFHSDSRNLDGHWLGGSNLAKHEHGIIIVNSGTGGKSAEVVYRKLCKLAKDIWGPNTRKVRWDYETARGRA